VAVKRRFYYFHRNADGDKPAGVTVSKRRKLPKGDFGITEYVWQDNGYVELWFIGQDRFTADERQQAWREFVGI